VPRAARLLLAALLATGGAVRAQEVRQPERPVAPRLTITLTRGAGDVLAAAVVRAEHLMDDGVFDAALHDGFPVRYHFRLELWRDARLFDRLERDVAWEAVTRLDPLTNVYQLIRTGGTVENFGSVEALARGLATPFTVDLVPRGNPGRRYYYVATLEVESLSLSELEEVERWLRGDFGRAISRRGDVGDALARGARRLLIRFSGLPRERIEARTERFTP
jgi:hypothetical protein